MKMRTSYIFIMYRTCLFKYIVFWQKLIDYVLAVSFSLCVCLAAMSKAAVKISADLLSNPLCEQDQAFLESMTALDTAMRRMDSFNQEKVRLLLPVFHTKIYCTISLFSFFFSALFSWHLPLVLDCYQGRCLSSDIQTRKLEGFLSKMHVFITVNIVQPVH